MKEYLTFADLEYEHEGSNDMRYYHWPLDRYVIFDSEAEFKEVTSGLTYQRNERGGFGSYVNTEGTVILSVAKLGGYERPVTLLNTSILTNTGNYQYRPIDLERAQSIARGRTIESAIGHQATAEILTELLSIPVTVNRVNYSQKQGHSALVFKLKGRVPEGCILSREQIDEIGYEFGVLTRLADDPTIESVQRSHEWRDV